MSLARVAGVRGVRRLFDIIILAARTRLPGISRKNGSLGLTAIMFHRFSRVLWPPLILSLQFFERRRRRRRRRKTRVPSNY